MNDEKEHYLVWSIDCTKIFDSSIIPELQGYNGNYYSCKIFVDGNLLHDTYISKGQYDYLKNNQSEWNLKYFRLGRCSMSQEGYWHYSKMHTYCMRLYNKGLSEEEIMNNYNTTKAYYSAVIEN